MIVNLLIMIEIMKEPKIHYSMVPDCSWNNWKNIYTYNSVCVNRGKNSIVYQYCKIMMIHTPIYSYTD